MRLMKRFDFIKILVFLPFFKTKNVLAESRKRETYEKKVRVDTYKTYRYCKCGGEMKYHKEVLLSNPIIFIHYCDKCRYKENYEKKYPTIEYIEEISQS